MHIPHGTAGSVCFFSTALPAVFLAQSHQLRWNDLAVLCLIAAIGIVLAWLSTDGDSSGGQR